MAIIEVFMGSNRQDTDEFRAEAVKQVIERGFSVVDVSTRIGPIAGGWWLYSSKAPYKDCNPFH